jgi:flagellar hook-length control protein FliK
LRLSLTEHLSARNFPMSASVNSVPGQAASAAKLLISDSDPLAATIDANGLGQFAAHFQRLIGKQLAVEIDAGQLPVSSERPAAAADPADELAALLPFIEALGLTQPSAVLAAGMMPAEPTATTSPAAAAIDAATTPLAAPVSPLTTAAATTSPTVPVTIATANTTPDAPAISAANASPQGQAHGFAAALPTALPATSEATEAAPNPLVSTPTPAEALSAGRELSSQLVAAIAASKESPASGNTAAVVHQVIANNSPAQSSTNRVDLPVPQPVGAPGWTEEIGNRIAWLANNSESRAELVLTPPQMGRIEVSLSIKGDQATANFASANPVVREALEAALPRLREILADAGIQLGQTQVSAENARQWAQQEKHGDNSASDQGRSNQANAAISPASSGGLSTATALKAGRGLVDVYA